MLNLISTDPDQLWERQDKLKTRFQISLLRHQYRNPFYMLDEGFAGTNTTMWKLIAEFKKQTGEN